MKRKSGWQKKQEDSLWDALLSIFLPIVVVALFTFELFVALLAPLPRALVITAAFFAILVGGVSVFFHTMGRRFQPLHRTPRSIIRMIDEAGCLVLFVFSFLGIFLNPVPQFILWVNVLILSRWLYDVIAMYIDDVRARKNMRMAMSCPEKIERDDD